MKPHLLTILILLILPILLMGTIDAQTTAVMPTEVVTGTTTRVSVASDGTQGNGHSDGASISADGRYVAFQSYYASNLVPGDTNGAGDIFVHDRQTGQTSRISVASDGTQGNGHSWSPSISADGRYVAFHSDASNLVPGDTNGRGDVFVHDRQTEQTNRISIASDGTQGNNTSSHSSISADGRYVVFRSLASNLVSSDTNNAVDIFVHDRQTGQISRVSVTSSGTQGNNHSESPSISADGRYVAFSSSASNLISSDTNNAVDIFVHDRQTGQTSRVSVASDGTQGNGDSIELSISTGGRYVAFRSGASNLVPGDTNGREDIFVHDRQTEQTSRVSVASDGTQGNGLSEHPIISADGRYVAFSSRSNNLVPGDTNGINSNDVFVHDRETGQISRVSVASDGTQANGSSANASISANGRYVAFGSSASNLVSGDTNSWRDIFVHDREGFEALTVSGNIRDANSNPIAGVTVSTNSGHSATTNTTGDYTITGLITGTYTLTPVKAGYTFSPMSRTVTVPPSATTQNFIGSGASERDWTLMFFLAADNDLDPQLTIEHQSVSLAGTNPNVHVVTFYDGPNSPAKYTVFDDGQVVGPFWQGELNTGDPTTLEQFISWTKSNYPAQNYALIISDHGHALGGVAEDLTSSKDRLSPKELKQALSANGPIDVLVMANCLMANLEIAYELRGLADYYVASQSISWLPRSHDRYSLSISENTTPEELAIAVAQSYYEDRLSFNGLYPSTISVVQLANVEDVAAKASTLAAAIRQHWLTTGITVWQIINDASILQRFEENRDFEITNKDRLADLYHFAQLLSSLPEPDIQNAANDLLSSLDSYILYNRAWSGPFEYQGQSHAWYHTNAHGVTVALPTSRMSFYRSDWLDFAGDPNWTPPNTAAFVAEDNSGSLEWGFLLVDLINEFNPQAPDTPIPPDPVAPLVFPSKLFLPFIQR